MKKITLMLLAMAVAISGCDDATEADAEETETEAVEGAEAAEGEAEGAAEEEAAEAEAPAAEAEVDLEPPAEGETTSLLSLREGFAADQDAWEGQTVTVTAQFMSATSVGGSLNNISLVVSQEDYEEDRMAHSMMCAFGDGAPDSVDLTQYDEVTVRGTVVERFGRAGLEDCEIVE